MNTISITNVKSWEYGLFKAAKVLGYVALSAMIAYGIDFFSKYHPSTNFGVAEVGLINVFLVGFQNWIAAHQSIKQVQTPAPVQTPDPIPVPVPTTPTPPVTPEPVATTPDIPEQTPTPEAG